MKKMEKALIALTLATSIFIAGSSFATMQDNSNGNRSNGNKSGTGAMMTSQADMDFANMAAQGGQAEIQMAQLALNKATSNDVKKYAQRMIKDHTKAGNNLDKIAAKKQMTLNKTPNEEQMQMMSQLQQASGAEFDRMYMQMAGVDAHQKMETLYQTEAGNGSDADLKSFAAKTLPVVQKHLRMAQEMTTGGMTMDSNKGGGNKNMNSDMGGSNMNGNSNRRTNSNNSNNSNR
jgi:putative membrane protein